MINDRKHEFLLEHILNQQSGIYNQRDVTPQLVTRSYLSQNGDSGQKITLNVDGKSFMREGPGRYATIADSPVVRSFFADSSLKPGEKYAAANRKLKPYPT